MDPFAQHRARYGDDRAFDNGGMAGQHRLDLGGIDLQPAAVDHIFLAIEHPDEIRRIDRTEIPAIPEPAGKTPAPRLWVLPAAFDCPGAPAPTSAPTAASRADAAAIH